MNTVKFAVFSDLHQDIIFDAPERLDAFLKAATEKDVDFIVQLGDFCHPKAENQFLIDQFNNFPKPHYHVLGNHDMDHHSKQDVIAMYGMPDRHYTFIENGFCFIACDANQIQHAEYAEDFERGNFRNTSGTFPVMPQAELDWLEAQIYGTELPIVLLSHHSLENDIDGVVNRYEIQSMINKATASGKKIMLAINGHHHTDFLRIIGKTHYFDLNSISNVWMEDEFHHYDYSEECHANHPFLRNIALYRDALFAIVTLSEDGTIAIEGVESTYDKRSPVDLGHENVISGRFCKPKVSSTTVQCL